MRSGKTDGVHQKTLNRLVKFIDDFKQLNFAGDKEMEQQLDRVRSELLTRSAEDYRNSLTATRSLESRPQPAPRPGPGTGQSGCPRPRRALRPDGPQEAATRRVRHPDRHTNTTHNRVGSHPRPCSPPFPNPTSIPKNLNTSNPTKTMSHFTTIQTQIRDVEALEAACAELGVELLRNTEARGFANSTRHGELVVRLKGPLRHRRQPCPTGSDSYELATDWWNGHVEARGRSQLRPSPPALRRPQDDA
jgi:hypothetical protein